MKKCIPLLLIALAIGCGFIACQGPNSTPAVIDLSLMDKEVRPQDDFTTRQWNVDEKHRNTRR